MRFTEGLRAISLATLVAIGGTTITAVPAAATDPAPSPTPAASSSPTPTPDPSLEPTPPPTETTAPDASPAPTASASPEATPVADVTPEPTQSPSPTTEPLATAAPTATPAPTPTPTPAPTLTVRQKIVRIAKAQLKDRYVAGGIGPDEFDCSGLVRYVYRRAGVSDKLGGGHSARRMYLWGRSHGLTSRRNPRVGDVVVYGYGSHVAIYIGNGYVLHALNPRQDIKITRLHAPTAPFTTFIHTRI